MDDNAIIELFFARSEQAIRELDGKYGKVCHSLSYNILHSRQDAEECVNDAYLGTWEAVPPARPNPLLAFLCRIVRNLSLMRYHADRAAKRGGGSYTMALEDCLASPRTVEGDMEEQELVRLIEDFLETLSPENRVILHAPVLVLRQLRGDRGAGRPVRKERVRPADPYPKAAAALF